VKEIKNKLDELKSISGLKNNDRDFKVGDVVRHVGPGIAIPQIENRGVAVVVSVNGPLFQAYWVGDGSVRHADARGGGYKLQDIAPIPQIAEWLESTSQHNGTSA
tara:strand:- start:168 stop:482 length:315 start_codon:yes stop_codon:yes gene_type:complete